MPKNKNAALRYEILDKLLRRSVIDRLCKEDIVDRLNVEYEKYCGEKGLPFNNVSPITVMRDIKDMRTYYNVTIKMERRHVLSAVYSYENEFVSIYNKNGMSSEQAHDVREALRRLRSSISHDQFSFLTKGGLDSRGPFRSLWELFMPKGEHSEFLLDAGAQVLVDRSPEDYEGAKHINTIHEAISLERILRVNYKPFSELKQEFDFHPSVLKQYNNRWYALGYDPDFTMPNNNTIVARHRSIALDRITDMSGLSEEEVQKRRTEGNNRDKYYKLEIEWEKYFSKIIGVSINLEDFKKGHNYIETEKIRIAFHPDQFGYEQTKPLHESAKEEKEKTEDRWSVRNYELYVNHEFYSQMVHLGDRARILSPEWLVEEFKRKLKGMMKNYDI